MINSVFLTGVLSEKIDDFYFTVKCRNPYPDKNGNFDEPEFICVSRIMKRTSICKAPLGSKISVKGRLEIDEEYGVVIVAETTELLNEQGNYIVQ